LADENAIVIKEGDPLGRIFFLDLYRRLHLHIEEYTFAEHDRTIAYSLSIPFASTLAFGAVMKHQDAPGTTFKRHMAIARGLKSEDDYLISEILFNPNTPEQLDGIIDSLTELREIVREKDYDRMRSYINTFRRNIS
ncbi:MAG: prephenate dehydrogenase/arogenate dehydrogenase family protein, partial [Muribaculaceae bacterium]|nr:prephenate dehydrogenase/arogenate dehydrogenase family protein [Muribaculaceae bacterium]